MNELYSRNLGMLNKRFPAVVLNQRGGDPAFSLEVSSSKAGVPTFSVIGKENKKVFFHSQFDPQKEARRFAGSLDLSKPSTLFIFGLGFGYYLREIRKLFKGPIFVIEPSLDILEKALESVDLEEVINDEGLFFITSLSLAQRMISLYFTLQQRGVENISFIEHPAYGIFHNYLRELKEGMNRELTKNPDKNIEAMLRDVVRFYLERLRRSNFKDENMFNHVRLISDLSGIHDMNVGMLFENAFYLFEEGNFPAALEAFSLAWGEDSLKLNNSYFQDRELVKRAAACYTAVAEANSPGSTVSGQAGKKPPDKLNLAYLTSQLVDETHSPTRNLRLFFNNHDRSRFNLYLYSSEIGAVRDNRTYWIGISTASSKSRGARFIKELKENQIPVYLAPVSGTHIDSAQELFKQIKQDKIDILFYHATMVSTIDYLVACWQPAPVQININSGAFIFSDKIDAVTYFAAAAFRQEKQFWDSSGIASFLMPSAADFSDRLSQSREVTRQSLGFSADTVLLVTVSNHLDTRISQEFLQLISTVISRDSVAWLIIGSGDFTAQLNYLSGLGLSDKVRFLGPQRDVFSYYKISDIYVNEFPRGGGMTVLEAMSMGLPVVSLYAGEHHLESCGAVYVGEQYLTRTPQQYKDFLLRLIQSRQSRIDIGKKMQDRFKSEFSAQKMVRAFEDLALGLYKNKIKADYH